MRDEDGDTKTVTFRYDPFGRRIEKKIQAMYNGVADTSTYTYVYDNEDIITESLTEVWGTEAETRYTRFIHGPGIDEPLGMERNGQLYYFHADGLGSTTAITDSNQTKVESYAYSSFGGVKRYGYLIWNTFTYTGREWDEETGLLYYRARYYDPEAGRFISKDPFPGFLTNPQTLNPYPYVQNNSTNFTDPWGLIWVSIGYDYHGKMNWLRWWLNRWTKQIGGGMDPTLPGSTKDEFTGITRDVIQEWQHDPNDPCRDKEHPIGSRRRIGQTYIKYINPGPNEALINDPNAPFYYQWTPWVGSSTYDNF